MWRGRVEGRDGGEGWKGGEGWRDEGEGRGVRLSEGP